MDFRGPRPIAISHHLNHPSSTGGKQKDQEKTEPREPYKNRESAIERSFRLSMKQNDPVKTSDYQTGFEDSHPLCTNIGNHPWIPWIYVIRNKVERLVPAMATTYVAQWRKRGGQIPRYIGCITVEMKFSVLQSCIASCIIYKLQKLQKRLDHLKEWNFPDA